MARLGIPAVLIGLFTWLLWEDRLGAASFTTLTGGALVVGLALQFGGRLREIDIKGKLILDKMETVKKDVYAKAESVARLAEDVVEAAVFSATKMNRLLDGKPRRPSAGTVTVTDHHKPARVASTVRACRRALARVTGTGRPERRSAHTNFGSGRTYLCSRRD